MRLAACGFIGWRCEVDPVRFGPILNSNFVVAVAFVIGFMVGWVGAVLWR